jgi:hypothetical protein
MELSTAIGTVGVSLLLLAFLLNLFRIVSEESLAYIILNIFGAGIACIASIMIEFVPFIVLEIIWVLVGVAGLIKYFIKRRRSASASLPLRI